MRDLLVRSGRRFTLFWWGDRGLSAFLLLLFATLFLGPLIRSTLLRGFSALFFSLLLVSGVAYVSSRRLLRKVAGAVALAAIVLHWRAEIYPGKGVAIADHLCSLLFLGGLTLVVLARVFASEGEVTSHRVRGAVAAYLLFGITFTILFRLLDLTLVGAFSSADVSPQGRNDLAYFSFVTLTTLGYGDITAVHPVARMFVILEALVGQLYPATLLARLVSLEISNREPRISLVSSKPEGMTGSVPGGGPE